MFCSAFFKNEIPILWGLVGFDGLSQEKVMDGREWHTLSAYDTRD